MELLKLLESIRTPLLDKLFLQLTWLGEQYLVISLICLFYWCLNKRLAYRICFSFFTAGLFVQTLKIVCRVNRPWVKDTSFTPVKKALKTATGYSFPSGHTQSATSTYSTFAFNTKNRFVKILCFVAIFALMLSRMYLGVHTPQDVIVSFILSFAISIFIDRMINRYELLDKHYKITACILCIVSILVMFYSLVMLKLGVTELQYTEDCCKAAGAGLGFSVGWYIECNYIRFSEKTSSLATQILKYLLGMFIAIILLKGLKIVIGTSLLAHLVRYFLSVLWITLGYPCIIKRFSTTLFK